MFLLPTPHKISNMQKVNPKASLKGCWKKNGHLIFFKCFFETNLHPFPQTTQNGVHMTLPLEEEIPMSTSCGLKMKVDLNCSSLSLPIKRKKNLTKIQCDDKGNKNLVPKIGHQCNNL